MSIRRDARVIQKDLYQSGREVKSSPTTQEQLKFVLSENRNCEPNRSKMAATKVNFPVRSDHESGQTSKKVTFFINGDRNFKGQVMVITPRRFRNVDMLLNELCRLTHFRDLPLGVRYLFSLESGTRVDTLDQLIDGKAYVCSSHSSLKKVSYGGKPAIALWSSKQHIDFPDIQRMPHNESKRRPVDVAPVRGAEPSRRRGFSDPRSNPEDNNRLIIKPKTVQVIRNGSQKPRPVVTALLNKRTAQNLEQVLDEVSNSLRNAGGLSPPRKLYSISGHQIRDVLELFRDENNIFIAVGSEKFSREDITDIMEDFEQRNSKKEMAKRKQSRIGNDGMSQSKQKNTKEHEHLKPIGKSVNKPEENKLPKLPDIHKKVENKPRPENINRTHVQGNSNPKRVHLAKNTYERTPEKKPTNSVKLPQIGNANLVSNSEKENVKNWDLSRQNNEESDRVNESIEPFDVREVDTTKPSRKVSVSKKRDNDKIDRKTSRDDGGITSEEEAKYGTVTDKTVEDVYDMGKKIGDGNFADVRVCSHKITKKDFALKIVDKAKIRGKEQMIRDEIDIMRKCNHPNIVRMYEDYDSTRHIYLVMELIKGGDLFDAISSSVKFTETVTKNYVKDIAKALAYLHKRKIVHRDLKPENLLVHKKPSGEAILKLADFGLAMVVKSPIFTVCGTPTYVAPEILEETGYGLKVDMWAAGVITYIMLCGFPPFRSAKKDQDELFDLIMEGDYEFLSPYWDKVSSEAKDLISKLLVVNHNQRYSAEEVLAHPWVGGSTDVSLSREYLGQNPAAKRRFKTAALAVTGVKRFEKLTEQFQRQRGEKIIIT